MADLDYVATPTDDSGGDQPVGTSADFGKVLGAGALDIGSNIASLSRYAFEKANSPHGAQISQALQNMFGGSADDIRDTLNPETKKLVSSTLTSPEFWSHPFLATALKATGMVPAVAALAIPGGLLADTVGATMAAAAGGAATNAGGGLDEFYKKLDEMSDDELKSQSPKYAALRQVMDESDARAKFNRDAQGWGPAINAVLGAAVAVIGPAGTAARGLAGGEQAVLGAGERGAIGRTLIAGAEGAGGNALQAGVGDVTQQNAAVNAHMQDQFDLARTANATLEGGALGGLMGGAVGLVAGGGAHGASGAAEKAASGAAEEGAGKSKVKAEEAPAVTSDAASPQPTTTGTSLKPAPPREDADIGNPQNAPTRSGTGGAKQEIKTKISAPKTPPDATIKVDPAIAQAAGAAQGAGTAPDLKPVTTPTPNATIDKLNGQQVTPGGNAPPAGLDTGMNVPEQPGTLAAQFAQIGQGDRKAVMLPKGTVVPADALPKGYKSIVTPRGRFIYDPKLIKHTDIQKLSAAGRENEFLGLGPVSKPEADARIGQGEQPVAVTERTPQGTEVKAAAGTDQTAPAQIASLERQKTPGNVIGVETPENVIAKRILPDLRQSQAEREAVAPKPPEAEAPKEEAKGKRYSVKEKEARDKTIATAKQVVEAHPPDEAAEDQYHRIPARRDAVVSRLRSMVDNYEKATGKQIQSQIKRSTKGDAPSDDPSMLTLRLAKDVVKQADKNPQGAKITEAVRTFKSDEALIRAGEKDEVIKRRLEEGDRASRKVGGEENRIEEHAAPEPEEPVAADADIVAKPGGEEGVGEHLAETMADTRRAEGEARHDEADVTESEKIEQGKSVQHIEAKLEKAKSQMTPREARKAALAAEAAKKEIVKEKVASLIKDIKKGAPEAAPVKAERKHIPDITKGERYVAREMSKEELSHPDIHPHAREVNVLRRWVNNLSDADYNKLRDAEVYNFPRSLADTQEPGRLLEAWKRVLAEEKRVFIDPGDYSKTIDQAERELNAKRESEALRVDEHPTEAQKIAGNYKKGHRRVAGQDFTMENLKGGTREGIGPDGKRWKVKKMPADYGYIRGSEGADGDHIDAYDLRHGDRHFVIDQLNHETGAFDEHKVMFRAKDERDALETYDKSFSDGHGIERVGNIHEVTAKELDDWRKSGVAASEPMTKSVSDEIERNLSNVNFDSPVPRGTKVNAEGNAFKPIRSMNGAEAVRRMDFSNIPGIGGRIAQFVKERLEKLADHVDVHYVDQATMDRLFPGDKGALGMHLRVGKPGARSEVFISERARPNGIEQGSEAHAVLHELVHAVTVREINNVPGALGGIRRLMNEALRHIDANDTEMRLRYGDRIKYGFKDEKEFLAEAFSNKHFQDFLSRVPLDSDTAKFFGLRKPTGNSIWDGLRAKIKEIIQSVTGELPQFDSALDGILKVGEHLMRIHDVGFAEPLRKGRAREYGAQDMVRSEALRLDKDSGEAVKRALERGLNSDPSKMGLRLRTFDSISRMSERYFGADNPVAKIHHAIEKMRISAQNLFEKGTGPILDKLAKLRAANADQFREFSSLLHDATIANVHPDVGLDHAKNAHLGKNKVVGTAVWSKSEHPELARRFNELSPEYKDMWHEVVKHFTDTQNEMTLGIIKNQVLKLMGIEDDTLAQRIHEGTVTDSDRTTLGSNLGTIEKAGELSKIDGPYVPLMRRGDHVVKADRKIAAPANAKKISDNEFEFSTEKAATDYAKQNELRTTIKKVWVNDKTGETFEHDPATGTDRKVLATDTDSVERYRAEVQNRHVEFVQGRRQAEARAAELAKDSSLSVHEVVPRAYEAGGRAAVDLSSSLGNLLKKLESSEAYKQSSPTQQAALRQAVNEAALASHGSTRVSSRALPRRSVAGYSEDLIQNTADYGQSSSRYLARLQHGPAIEAGMKQMQEQLDRDHSKVGQYARTQISNEVQQRVNGDNGFQQGGKLNPYIKRALSVSFIDKLGSPAYSVINATQPGMITLPYLAGKHGIGRSFAALARAYNDIGAGGILKSGLKETGRRIAGKKAPEDFITSITKNLSPDERAMIQHHLEIGTIDPSAGMEISEIAKTYEGIGGKADKMLGYLEGVTREMPRAIEAINRAVTAISAYRLERARGADHEAAVKYSENAVNETQFNYSPTNSPAVFNHPLYKMAFQFKKFAQGIYQLIGSQIGKAMRNESPGDRAQAIKTLIGLAATHTAIAGALGLPTEPFKYLVMGAQLFGSQTSWGDVEDKIREQAAHMFGKSAGEALTRGIPRLFNVDLSRAGLDTLTSFGEPKSSKRDDVFKWLAENASGPVVSLGMDWGQGINQIANGNYEKAAENLIPLKAASDSLRAYRQATEGKKTGTGKQSMTPYSPTETALRVLGFGSGREAEEGAEKSHYYRESARQKEERGGLVNAWANADNAGKTKAWADIQKYNKDQPDEVKITAKELTNKAKRDAKQAQTAKYGISASKRDKRFLNEGIFNTGAP